VPALPFGCSVRPNSDAVNVTVFWSVPTSCCIERTDSLAPLLQQRVLGPDLRTVGIETAQLAEENLAANPECSADLHHQIGITPDDP
jgi:hypothetical protein